MNNATETVVNVYNCDDCKFRYDPADFGGVEFDAQPDDFMCPNCQAGKDHFHMFTPPDDDIVNAEEVEPSESRDPSGPRVMYTQSADPSLESLHNRYKKGRLITQPDFQRYEVWSPQKRSALIESILLDLPVPQVFFAQEEDGSSVVIDGQQRLMSIFRYMNNEYALSGLNESKIDGKKFDALSPALQEKIENFVLHVVEVLKESDPEVRFTLFQRLNEGSVSLNDQELRNCVMRGDYNEFIKALADEPAWRKKLNLRARHPRMVDVELVLRYMAFRDQTYLKHPDKKTGKFLDKQMTVGASLVAKELQSAKKDFKTAIDLAGTVFGPHAFRRWVAGTEKGADGAWDKRINRALMDVQLWGFARYDKGLFVKNSDGVREAAIELMSDPTFANLITHTISEKKRVEERFDMWKSMLDSVLKGNEQGDRLFSFSVKEAAFNESRVCAICKQTIQTIDDAHMDHVEPYSKGGKTNLQNAALTHRYCNLVKSNRS